MSEGLTKMLSIVLYVLMGISALLGILFYAGAASSDVLIYWCYILLFIGTLAAIVFPIMHMVKNPKSGKAALIGIGGIVVIFLISYLMAGDEMIDKYDGFISGPAASKRVSTGLISFYILAAGAVGVTVFSGVTKFFK